MKAPKEAVYVEFDRRRKLYPRMRYIRDVVLASKRSVTELVQDPFGGHPWLVQALTQPSARQGENITLDKASEMLDAYYDNGGTVDAMRDSLMKAVADYLTFELTPTFEEEEEAVRTEDPNGPNGDTPDAPGPSAG
jgi:hypothetical protein